MKHYNILFMNKNPIGSEKSKISLEQAMFLGKIINSVEEKNPLDLNGNSPLHEAVYNAHLNICKLIINTTVAHKNPANYQGITPLHIASLNGHFEICKLIVFNTTEKNPKDNIGATPLHNAAWCGHIQICRRIIIPFVFDKNPRSNDGNTPLHAAARNGHFEVCKAIMVNVQNEYPINNDGMTPQAYAHQYFNNLNQMFL